MDIDQGYLLVAQELAGATKVALPKTYFRYGLAVCWKCRDRYNNRQKILVFDWPLGAPETAEPRPSTLAYHELIGDLNTCPYCGSMQGPYRLHHSRNGPFTYVKMARLYTHESFVADINLLAQSARERGIIR